MESGRRPLLPSVLVLLCCMYHTTIPTHERSNGLREPEHLVAPAAHTHERRALALIAFPVVWDDALRVLPAVSAFIMRRTSGYSRIGAWAVGGRGDAHQAPWTHVPCAAVHWCQLRQGGSSPSCSMSQPGCSRRTRCSCCCCCCPPKGKLKKLPNCAEAKGRRRSDSAAASTSRNIVGINGIGIEDE